MKNQGKWYNLENILIYCKNDKTKFEEKKKNVGSVPESLLCCASDTVF